MSVRGGRAILRLLVAAALLVPVLLPLAPAQSASDPWFGTSDRSRPTAGWAVRIPVTVENNFDYALFDPFVAAEVDFAQLLVAAGWTNASVGAETKLRNFTLDLDSIRVVEYNRGFVTGPISGSDTRPTPHVFYPAMLESTRAREFHAERSPAGTIVWQIPGIFGPQEKRAFYIYANPLEYTKTPPPVFDAGERAPLDAFLWGTRGNVYLGYTPQQERQGHFVEVVSTAFTGLTTVRVYTYELGRFTLLPTTSAASNPFVIGPGGVRQLQLPGGKAYKIEADKPIVVFAGGPGNALGEGMGYVPGRSGSFADDFFNLRTHGTTSVRVIKASPGTVTVTEGVNGATRTLSNAVPATNIVVPAEQWTTLSGDGKFLVSLDTAGQSSGGTPIPYPPHQVPATSGGPSGVDFYTYLNNDQGYYRLCPESNATLRVVDFTTGGTFQIYPEGSLPAAPAARLSKGDMCTEVAVQRGIDAGDVYEFYSTKEERDPPPGSPVPFRLFVGTKERTVVTPSVNYTRPMIGHYGGLAGTDHYVNGPTGILFHYNHTRVTIFEEKIVAGEKIVTNRTLTFQRDTFFTLTASDASSTGNFHIVANKPVATVALGAAQFQVTPDGQDPINQPITYSVYPPGRPLMPSITLGAAEFRGPLVDVRSPSKPGSQFDSKSTGPGSPLAYPLQVYNLGRWIGGEGLVDNIVVTCSTPTGWTIEGCNREFTLSGGSSERLNVVVTPSIEDVNQTRTILVEARSKAGGVAASFKLNVFVEVRYGVGMWFDLEGGRKTIDPPIGLDPGKTHSYRIILKNTGSTTDTFRLAADEARTGWTQDLLLDGEPVTSVRLDGGETVELEFRVKAPNAETAPQNIVSITAQSETSALAADVVNTATRIRPKVDLELTLDPQTRLAEPNETVVFNLTTRNKGNDVFTVIFRQDSILPKGWNATLSIPEITLNPNPSNDPALNYVLQVAVRPPEGARAGDLASVKLTAEIDTGGAGGRVTGDEVSAVVVVRRVYALATPPSFDAEATPGEALSYVLPVTNLGNGQVSLEILPGATTPPWPVTLNGDGITLGLNDTGELPLLISVPEGTPPGTYNLTFTTRLSREAIQNLSIPVNVRALARVDLEGATSVSLTPGRPASLAYVARNSGNVAGDYTLTAAAPAGWNGSFSPRIVQLAPGESLPVLLTLNASREAADGSSVVTLSSQAAGAAPTTSQLSVRVARPELTLSNVEGSGTLRPGELVLVTSTIANSGGMEAENVSVALVVDGQVVDRVLLARIPVGSSALATLSWVSTQRGGDVRVVLDPEQEIVLADRAGTESDVSFAKSGIPGPGVAAIISLLGALAAFGHGARGGPGVREGAGHVFSKLRGLRVLRGLRARAKRALEREPK